MRLSYFLIVLLATFVGFTSAENVAFVPKTDKSRRLRDSVVLQTATNSVKGIVESMQAKMGVNSGKLTEGLKTTAQLGDDQVAKIEKILTNSEKARTAMRQVNDNEIARVSILIEKANAELFGVADDGVAKLAQILAAAQKSAKATDDQIFAIAKWVAQAKKVGAVTQPLDSEAQKVAEMFKTAIGRTTIAGKFIDDDVVKLSKGLANAQKGAGLTDKQVAKLVKLFTEAKRMAPFSNLQAVKLAQGLTPVAVKDKKSWSALKKIIVATLGVTGGAAVIYAVVKLTSSKEGAT